MNASVQLLEQALPTTVHLQVDVPETHPSSAVLGTERAGTGTVVAENGLVITVNYIVLGARTVKATLLDGRELTADVVAQDFHSGLALLRLPGNDHQAAPLRPEPEVSPGDDVFIVASAGDASRRASSGGVTAVALFEANWEYALDPAIYTTAMNPGLGGGPLFDPAGRLAGVISLNLNEIGRFSLAVPISHFRDHRDELLKNGRRVTRPSRAWLGLYCYTLRSHVVIAGLLPAAPAARAGLTQGDVIVSVDDGPVTSRKELYDRLWTHRAGDRIALRVYRNDDIVRFDISSADVEEFFA